MSEKNFAPEDRDPSDARLFSPSAGRNQAVIADVLAGVLPANATVLEIASGTGEHGIANVTRRPDVTWQFSDPDETARASQAAWAAHTGLGDLPPLAIDTTRTDWAIKLPKYDALYCANMIHIAPWDAAVGLAQGADTLLDAGGQVILYGPFFFGENSAPSNLAFDANLKGRNSTWGVRQIESVKHIFAKKGFNIAKLRDMPKNNFLLGLSRH